MNRTWNKIVLAALVTAGASAGILYLKHRQDIAAQPDPEETEPEEGAAQTVAADRNYINLTPAHESEPAEATAANADEESAAEEPVRVASAVPTEDASGDETHTDVHFSSL